MKRRPRHTTPCASRFQPQPNLFPNRQRSRHFFSTIYASSVPVRSKPSTETCGSRQARPERPVISVEHRIYLPVKGGVVSAIVFHLWKANAPSIFSRWWKNAEAASGSDWRIDFSVTKKHLETPVILQSLWSELGGLGLVTTSRSHPVERPCRPMGIAPHTNANPSQIADAFAFMPGCNLQVKTALATPSKPETTSPQITPSTAESATEGTRTSALKAATTTADTLRVSSDRLDRLSTYLAIVILKSVRHAATCEQHPESPPSSTQLRRPCKASHQLRDEVLNIRMMQSARLLKFRRSARDLSAISQRGRTGFGRIRN